MRLATAAVTALLLVGTAFSANLEPPVDSGRLVVDVDLEHRARLGAFDESGERRSYGSGVSISTTSFGLAVKYDFVPGLEVAAGWSAKIEEFSTPGISTSPAIGFDRPWIGVEYMHSTGIGALLCAGLPWGSSDIVGTRTPTTFTGGVLGLARVGSLDLEGALVGSKSTKPSGAIWLGDSVTARVRLDCRVDRRWWASLGTVWSGYEGAQIPGWIPPSAGWFLRLEPGVRFGWSNRSSLRLTVPVELLGRNAPAGYGIRIETFGAGL